MKSCAVNVFRRRALRASRICSSPEQITSVGRDTSRSDSHKHQYPVFSRPKFLTIATGAALSPALLFAANPTLGLTFPPENYPIPPDAKLLFPSGVDFIGNGVGLPGGMTVEGYDEAVPRILPRAADLAKQGANVISVFGSSLTFYKGAKFHDDLIRHVEKATGHRPTSKATGCSMACAPRMRAARLWRM